MSKKLSIAQRELVKSNYPEVSNMLTEKQMQMITDSAFLAITDPNIRTLVKSDIIKLEELLEIDSYDIYKALKNDGVQESLTNQLVDFDQVCHAALTGNLENLNISCMTSNDYLFYKNQNNLDFADSNSYKY